MGPKWKRSVGYLVRSDVRGKFDVGPMKVRLSDPFGLIELERTFRTRSTLVVTPRVVPLPVVPLSGVWTGSGDNRPRAFASGSAEDVTVREYRRGDDLRRVHWRSSAHAGELMVRREEQPWQSRATLFVDNRKIAHRGTGAASSLEHAVSLAASIAVHLVQRGFSVRLVTASGAGPEQHLARARCAGGRGRPLLEQLAVLTDTTHPHLDLRWLQEAGHSGLLIAVLGDVAEHDKPVLDPDAALRLRCAGGGARRTRLGARLRRRSARHRAGHGVARGARLARRLGRAAGPVRRGLAGARHVRAQRQRARPRAGPDRAADRRARHDPRPRAASAQPGCRPCWPR